MKRDTWEGIVAGGALIFGFVVVTAALGIPTVVKTVNKQNTPAQEVPVKTNSLVYLKSGGDFANYCKVSTKNDYDRIVNFRNVSTLRKIEDKRLVVDNRLIILFNNSVERETFIKEVGY